jgi:hypothetical protein
LNIFLFKKKREYKRRKNNRVGLVEKVGEAGGRLADLGGGSVPLAWNPLGEKGL